ncbi:MAG: FHA domain-containing protein [Chloroflexi bacterium]|nr:FHA domain-containing protein [Chloroflexota bacterium]
MDAFTLTLWVVRIGFLVLLYLFFVLLARMLWRDLRATAAASGRALGRLVVLASPEGQPPAGANLLLDAVNSLGRDVNNTIIIDDSFASAEHTVLTFRGRAWYLEDRGSTNGTWLNGQRLEGVSPLGFGDEIQVGQVRMRLERSVTS